MTEKEKHTPECIKHRATFGAIGCTCHGTGKADPLREEAGEKLAWLRGLAWSLLPELRKVEFREQADQIIPLIEKRVRGELEDLELIKNHHGHKKGEVLLVSCPRCTYEALKGEEESNDK